MPEPYTDQGTTSLSLLERARNRDADAWRRLVELCSPLIFFWAQREGLPHADAADVVQEVWRSVAASLSRFHRDERTGTFRGWLWTITRNKLIDHFRKREAQPTAAGGADAHKFIESVPEAESADETGAQEHHLLHRALAQIKPEFEERTWLAFWRMTVDDQTAADVGQELLLAPNAVHQAKFRVLRRLREEMAGLIDA
jgi:RNA polymerase sigma-70 factor, ECF subfamily